MPSSPGRPGASGAQGAGLLCGTPATYDLLDASTRQLFAEQAPLRVGACPQRYGRRRSSSLRNSPALSPARPSTWSVAWYAGDTQGLRVEAACANNLDTALLNRRGTRHAGLNRTSAAASRNPPRPRRSPPHRNPATASGRSTVRSKQLARAGNLTVGAHQRCE